MQDKHKKAIRIAAGLALIAYAGKAYWLKQPEAAEMLAHIAFYAGWPNVFSAMPIAKDVFAKRPK